MNNKIKAVVLDWAGTMIDYGSCAPAVVFQEIFRQQAVEISSAQARQPMGMAKREHIKAITEIDDVRRRWLKKFTEPPSEVDIDAMYKRFLPLQKSTLAAHCDLIPGAAEAAKWCRQRGIKIAGTTGYTTELMQVVLPAARDQGYSPDVSLGADDVPAGRPRPWLIFEAAKRLDVFPVRNIVKVDDTVVGIQAGLNAGTWTVAVTKTGNEIGLSLDEVNRLDATELATRLQLAEEKFKSAGAHFVIQSVKELPRVIGDINDRLVAGDRP